MPDGSTDHMKTTPGSISRVLSNTDHVRDEIVKKKRDTRIPDEISSSDEEPVSEKIETLH